MENVATLLTPPYNFAVVQLPGRQHPGVVVQGDTLSSIVNELGEARQLMSNEAGGEAKDIVDDLHERLSDILKSYIKVCGKAGRELPFVSTRN